MKNKNMLVMGVAILAVILIAGYLVFNVALKGNLSKNTAQNQTNTQQKIVQVARVPQEKVTLTGSGFNPQTLTIKTGTMVIWENKSSAAGSVNSDDYPTNLKYRFLNLGKFEGSSTVGTTFTKPGTYAYHNQSNPNQKGTVIVK